MAKTKALINRAADLRLCFRIYLSVVENFEDSVSCDEAHIKMKIHIHSKNNDKCFIMV